MAYPFQRNLHYTYANNWQGQATYTGTFDTVKQNNRLWPWPYRGSPAGHASQWRYLKRGCLQRRRYISMHWHIAYLCACTQEPLAKMNNMIVNIESTMFSAAMDKNIIRIRLRIASMRTKQLRHQTGKRCRVVRQSLWHNQQLQSIHLGHLTAVIGASLARIRSW